MTDHPERVAEVRCRTTETPPPESSKDSGT
jgi:hypothetical protein